jgi:biopolymer transport protein ExbD
MPLKTHIDEQPSLNMTPMIDCVFLLLIFFMLGTKFSDPERNLRLRVPEVADRGVLTAPPQRKIINVFRDGTITFDQKRVSLEELKNRLSAVRNQYSDLGVLVRGDARGEFQNVAAVLNTCKQVGVKDLGIMVKPFNP